MRLTTQHPAIVVDDIHRSFGKVKANNGISLSVEPGQVVGLLGHNGAGKTTMVSQIVGLLKPDSGRIHVAGVDAVADPARARRQVSVQSQSQAPVEGLTPRGAIEISAKLRGGRSEYVEQAVEALADELEIRPWLDRRALPEGAGLSGGIRRLTSFAMSVVAPTPVLVLDEPTNDVDAHRRRLLWSAVRRRADEGAGVLLVTHNVAEIDQIVDKLVILEKGTVIAQGTIDELRGPSDLVRLTYSGGDVDGKKPFLVEKVHHSAGRTALTLRMEQLDAATTWAIAQRAAGRLESFSVSPMTLEDVYLDLTANKDTGAKGLANV